MPIQYVAGDLFANRFAAQAFAHGCNCQGSMGAGIAKTFREALNYLLHAFDWRRAFVVTSEAPDRNVRKVEIGVSQLTIRSIRRIPPLLGEVDVVRSLLLLPGVTTVGEGAPGFNVIE